MPLLKHRPRAAKPRFGKSEAVPVFTLEKRQKAANPATQKALRELGEKNKAVLWPLVIGLVLGMIAPWMKDQLVELGPWAMRAVFPFAVLAGRNEIGLSHELTRTLPQLVIYFQFPLEGLLTRYSLGKGANLRAALGQILFLHCICTLVLWLVAGSAL